MTVTLTDAGEGQFRFTVEAVRGDDAVEALADLLMGPGSLVMAALTPVLIGIVVRRGIDSAWLAHPAHPCRSGRAEPLAGRCPGC